MTPTTTSTTRLAGEPRREVRGRVVWRRQCGVEQKKSKLGVAVGQWRRQNAAEMAPGTWRERERHTRVADGARCITSRASRCGAALRVRAHPDLDRGRARCRSGDDEFEGDFWMGRGTLEMDYFFEPRLHRRAEVARPARESNPGDGGHPGSAKTFLSCDLCRGRDESSRRQI